MSTHRTESDEDGYVVKVAPAFPFVGARAQVTVAEREDGTPSAVLVAGDWVTVIGSGRSEGNVEVLRDGRNAVVAARNLSPVPVSPGPDQPTGHEDWWVGKHHGIHVYASDHVVATFHRPEDAARAVSDHQDAPALRAEVQRLTGALAEARARQVEDTRELNTLTDDVLKARAERDAARAELDAATTDWPGLPSNVTLTRSADGPREATVGGAIFAIDDDLTVDDLKAATACWTALLRARLADEAPKRTVHNHEAEDGPRGACLYASGRTNGLADEAPTDDKETDR